MTHHREPAGGIDLGGTQPIVLSDGPVIDAPRTKSEDGERLATERRTLARRKKGSRKAPRRVAMLQAGFTRRRKVTLHKVTTFLVKSHGFTVIEDLKVREMSRTVQIRKMLEYKAPWSGYRLIVVDASRTSQRAGRQQRHQPLLLHH